MILKTSSDVSFWLWFYVSSRCWHVWIFSSLIWHRRPDSAGTFPCGCSPGSFHLDWITSRPFIQHHPQDQLLFSCSKSWFLGFSVFKKEFSLLVFLSGLQKISTNTSVINTLNFCSEVHGQVLLSLKQNEESFDKTTSEDVPCCCCCYF